MVRRPWEEKLRYQETLELGASHCEMLEAAAVKSSPLVGHRGSWGGGGMMVMSLVADDLPRSVVTEKALAVLLIFREMRGLQCVCLLQDEDLRLVAENLVIT